MSERPEDVIRKALDAYRKQAFNYGWVLTERLQDRADAALAQLVEEREQLKAHQLHDHAWVDAKEANYVALKARADRAEAALREIDPLTIGWDLEPEDLRDPTNPDLNMAGGLMGEHGPEDTHVGGGP